MPTIHEMEKLGWGNPDLKTFERQNIATVADENIALRVNKEVKPLFHALVLLLARKYDLDLKKDDWGYANRDIRGVAGTKSYHAWGLAVDLNATQNVLGSHDFQFDAEVVQPIAENLGLLWGGTWTKRPDPMHFEFRGAKHEVAKAITKMRRRYPLVARKVLK